MAEINHKERAHAILSASGSSRWLNCTPSARLEAEVPETTSVFAEEGTLAHEIAEIKLRLLHEPHTDLQTRLEEARQKELYHEDMDYHTDNYVSYVREIYSEALAKDHLAVVETEVRVNLTKYVPEGFGTVDNAVIGNGTLDVIDLKYGKGVAVSATDNSQLKLYALGALEAYSFLYDIDTVRLHIHQPRLDAISVFEISASELLEWGQNHVIPKAQEAFEGNGEQVTGSWCGFCKVKHRCAAMAKEAESVAALDFADPKLLTDEQVLEVYGKADRLVRWLSGLGDYILTEALSGKQWEGYKLVEGRSNRRISDSDKAITLLENEGFIKEDFMKMDLQGIGALEKLLGKKDFEKVLGGIIEKPEGKPTLVPVSDKRQAIDLASDFD